MAGGDNEILLDIGHLKKVGDHPQREDLREVLVVLEVAEVLNHAPKLPRFTGDVKGWKGLLFEESGREDILWGLQILFELGELLSEACHALLRYVFERVGKIKLCGSCEAVEYRCLAERSKLMPFEVSRMFS